MFWAFFFFQAEDGIRNSVASRGLGDWYKRQVEGGGENMPPTSAIATLPPPFRLRPHMKYNDAGRARSHKAADGNRMHLSIWCWPSVSVNDRHAVYFPSHYDAQPCVTRPTPSGGVYDCHPRFCACRSHYIVYDDVQPARWGHWVRIGAYLLLPLHLYGTNQTPALDLKRATGGGQMAYLVW